jgi:hypothetical protein
MIFRIFGQKDTTIYEQTLRKTQNAGVDEILEVTKFFDELTETDFEGNSRVLIQFDISTLSSSLASGDIGADSEFYLNLSSTEQTEVQAEYDLEIYQVSQSWTEGIGQFFDNPKTVDGCSWEFRNDTDRWLTGSFALGSTGSSQINNGGGTWYTASFIGTEYSQTFNKSTNDLGAEVTNYVLDWISGSRDNHGFLVKRTDVAESGSSKFGSSKFFSNETHTIYVPTLEARWDDSSFETGSLQELTAEDILIYPKNLRAEYTETSRGRIRIVGRERYPTRTFSTSSAYTTVKYLPTSSYYQLRDVETNLVMIPYDTSYTKISCDSTGNYFDFRFDTLQPERFYQFEFRVDRGTKKEFFTGYVFKVVR